MRKTLIGAALLGAILTSACVTVQVPQRGGTRTLVPDNPQAASGPGYMAAPVAPQSIRMITPTAQEL